MTKQFSGKIGLGIRPELFSEFAQHQPALGFVEAHSENYFGDSIARQKLLECRETYQVSLHGVGLSLGRADGLDREHLKQLKQLADEVDALFVSEHLAWSAYSHRHLPDLLPLPLTEESLRVFCEHVDQMQTELDCQILIENPSNYLLFDQLQIPETEFLNELASSTGCGVLLDVNNVYVSAVNVGRDPQDYINSIKSKIVHQYHLAGHTETQHQQQRILIDTHNQSIADPVWELYQFALQKHGVRHTLIEWDSDFPKFEKLIEQCLKAEQYLLTEENETIEIQPRRKPKKTYIEKTSNKKAAFRLGLQQHQFLDAVLHQYDALDFAQEQHQQRIGIYQNNAFTAVADYLMQVYPAMCGVVGEPFFRKMAKEFLKLTPPQKGNINLYGKKFKQAVWAFPELDDMAYLPDLMRYEWALHQSYFAETEVSLQPSEYSQDDLLSLPIRLKNNVHLVKSEFPIYEIHRQSLPDYSGEVSINLNQSKDKLIVFKRGQRVESLKTSEAEYSLIDQLKSAPTLLDAIEVLAGTLSEEQISMGLSLVFQQQLLIAAK